MSAAAARRIRMMAPRCAAFSVAGVEGMTGLAEVTVEVMRRSTEPGSSNPPLVAGPEPDSGPSRCPILAGRAQRSERASGPGPSALGVTATPLRPESLDLDIFRELYRGGAANLAGFDPRLNATRIAQHLRVGRARVAGRLNAWNDSGFLARYDVWLNLALFGW